MHLIDETFFFFFFFKKNNLNRNIDGAQWVTDFLYTFAFSRTHDRRDLISQIGNNSNNNTFHTSESHS